MQCSGSKKKLNNIFFVPLSLLLCLRAPGFEVESKKIISGSMRTKEKTDVLFGK